MEGLGVSRTDGTQVTEQTLVEAKEWPDGDGAFRKEVAVDKEVDDKISLRIQVQQSEAKQESQKTQVARESLRYDGKLFREWRTYLTTELKPGLRIEGLKAMGIFGANGYAEEAASVILKVVQGYNRFSGNADDEKVTIATEGAIRRIGPATLPVLIRALKNRKSKYARRFATRVLSTSSNKGKPIWPEMKAAVPALIEAASGDDAPLCAQAIYALSTIDPDGERGEAALIKVTKD